MPGSAVAATECDNGGTVDTGPQVSSNAIASLCVDTDLLIDGGYVEVGAGDPGPNGDPGYYAVIDGSDSNPSGTPLVGYGALSTYETGDRDACEGNIWNAPNGGPIEDTDDTGSGTNSGGCLTIRSVASIPGVPLACGNTSGADFAGAGRDGCTIP